MTDTPNTSRPSEAIQRYTARVGYSDYRTNFWVEMDAHEQGGWVKHSDALAWVARARDEARREAWNNALVCAENAVLEVARSRKNKRTNAFTLPLQDIKAIRALAVPTPTPQGETKEQQP